MHLLSSLFASFPLLPDTLLPATEPFLSFTMVTKVYDAIGFSKVRVHQGYF